MLRPTSIYSGLMPAVSKSNYYQSNYAAFSRIYSPCQFMHDVWEKKEYYRALWSENPHQNSAYLVSDAIPYYQLPSFWGIDLNQPPLGDTIDVTFIDGDPPGALYTPYFDKVFSRWNVNMARQNGGVVEEDISLDGYTWLHPKSGAEIDVIPAGWYRFGYGVYYDMQYLSWNTAPLAPPGIAPMLGALALLGLASFLMSGTVPAPRKPRK